MEKLFAIFAFAVLLLSGCIDKPTYEGRAFENEPQENKEWEGPDGSYPRENNRKISPVQNAPDTYVKPQLQDIKQTPASDCKKPAFTEYLVDTKYLNQVGQVGTVHGSGHFTIERSYISVKSEYERQKIPIYAPANMTLARGSYYQVPAPQGQYLGEPMPDYALYFDAGCGVEVALGHLKEAVPKIASQFSKPKQDSRTDYLQPVKFTAGELIGYYIPGAGVAAFDFFAYDQSVLNTFANQARHEFGYGDPMLHAVCPYDYYTGEMKATYYGLIPGSALNKNCGPISRDYQGTISGSWFLEKEPTKYIYDYSQEGTYGSSLPIAGDYDRVIIGTIGSRTTTFVYPNDPTYRDPKEVTGEHCYNTYDFSNPSQPTGHIYFKLIDNETLKVFYGETGQCPNGFPSSGGATYYR